MKNFGHPAKFSCLRPNITYIYISLDTFHSISQNINSYLDAWFTFLSSDAPDDILRLIEVYPEFKAYYHDIALFRKNPKELMNMYSEALLQLDRNTEIYMIEEMKKEIADMQKEKTISKSRGEIIKYLEAIKRRKHLLPPNVRM